MKTAAWLGFLGLVWAPLSLAQSAKAHNKSPAFETATVKPRAPNNAPPSISPYGTEHFTITNTTFELLLEIAFGVNPNQVSGAPDWVNTARYDVDAKAEAGASLTFEQVRPRLKQLLRQRFRLASHLETKQVDGYVLLVAPGGAKLRRSMGASGPGRVYPGGFLFQNITVSDFAPLLQSPLGRPVIDRTGIKGNYDITLRYAPNGTANGQPSLFAALQDQLGLVVEAQQVAIDVLVIDHVDRTPTTR